MWGGFGEAAGAAAEAHGSHRHRAPAEAVTSIASEARRVGHPMTDGTGLATGLTALAEHRILADAAR